MKPFRYDSEAREEYLEAARWYAERNEKSAERFRLLIRDAENAIKDAPDRWPLTPNVPRHLEVRRRLLPGFPYSMIYLDLSTEILASDLF